MSHVLEGIKVVDLSRALAGPFAAMTLGDMGADVLKVGPGRGDPTRDFPPFWDGNGESCYYLKCERNKRSLTLNLDVEEGRAIVKRLIVDADILIESFRTGHRALGSRLGQSPRPESPLDLLRSLGSWS